MNARVNVAPDRPPPTAVDDRASRARHTGRARGAYAGAVGAVAVAALLAWPLSEVFDPANVVMVFLSAVVLVGYRWGRGPAVLASVLGVAVFDVAFVPPRWSFAVSDAQYLVTFATMLAVGLTVGQLTAGLREQAQRSAEREARARALYELARELSAAMLPEQIEEALEPALQRMLGLQCRLLLPGPGGYLTPLPALATDPLMPQPLLVRHCFETGDRTGPDLDDPVAAGVMYLPLRGSVRIRGVLAVGRAGGLDEPSEGVAQRQQLLETVAHLVAIAVERLHYVEVAQAATVRVEAEQVRTTLLSALSHDLRTPLTALVGWADVLAMSKPPLAPSQARIASAIGDEARRTSRLVENLLEMARLASGALAPRMQWHSIEELVGGALACCGSLLDGAAVTTSVPADLPLVRCDAVLIERVLVNLLENAAKYGRTPATPSAASDEAGQAGTLRIDVEAMSDSAGITVSVADRGPGLPAALMQDGDASALFEKFTRGERESAVPGVGLGLSICRAIVEAHGGRIEAADRADGGARFAFTLPCAPQPAGDPAEPPHRGETAC